MKEQELNKLKADKFCELLMPRPDPITQIILGTIFVFFIGGPAWALGTFFLLSIIAQFVKE